MERGAAGRSLIHWTDVQAHASPDPSGGDPDLARSWRCFFSNCASTRIRFNDVFTISWSEVRKLDFVICSLNDDLAKSK